MNNLNKIKEQSKSIKKQINDVFQEKVELEEIVIQQEERVLNKINQISNLEKKMKVVDEMLKNKNIEIKKNEQHCMSLIKIIEEQKKNISNLNNRLNNIYQNDIESSNLIKSDNSFSKDHFIKNSSDLIFDNSMEKDNNLTKKSLELNHPINPKEGKKTKSKEDFIDYSKKLTKIPRIMEKKLVDDEDNNNDSNLKDITVMMKKILDDIQV